MKRRPMKVLQSTPPYPSRADNPLPRHHDAGRRRFLRQLASGGALAAAGLPTLAHGQSLPIDFDKLESHPRPLGRAEEPEPAALAEEAAADLEPPLEGAAMADQMLAAQPTPAPAEPPTGGEVVENRALWVEPGYLILLRWSRPADNDVPVAALEGAADQLRSFFAARVTTVDQIHNIEHLHVLEQQIIDLLGPEVLPARIEVLHLDHDCTVVCSALDPSTSYPEPIMLLGEPPPPGWE